MAKNGEPPLSSFEINSIVADSDALAAEAKPASKNIMADPVHEHGVFQHSEPELTDIKASIAKSEAEVEARRQAAISERLKTTRENAKKNSPIYMVDVG